jgi:DNA-binding MarR family transcriptional regulator
MTHLSGSCRAQVQSSDSHVREFSTCGGNANRTGSKTVPEGATPSGDGAIQKIIEARKLRARFFDQNLFADPAWDILLDLYRAHLAQQRICITSVCFGAGVPVTTALRWLNALEERGLAKRSHDPLDGRRFFVSLTEKGASAMSGYFAVADVAI